MESPAQTHLMKLLAVLIFGSSMVAASSPLMAEICHSTAATSPNTITYDDCVNALNMDPWSESSNLIGLARLALNLGVSNTTDTQNFIQNLINSKQTDPPLINSLKNCLSFYDAAKNSFTSALAEVGEDLTSANYDAKVAGEGADHCDEELSKVKAADTTSVTTRNRYVRLYSSIGVVITDRLSKT